MNTADTRAGRSSAEIDAGRLISAVFVPKLRFSHQRLTVEDISRASGTSRGPCK